MRLDRTRVVTIVGELFAGIAEHVGMRLDAQIGGDGWQQLSPAMRTPLLLTARAIEARGKCCDGEAQQ